MKKVFFTGSKLGKYKNGTILRSCEKDEDKWAQCCPCTVIMVMIMIMHPCLVMISHNLKMVIHPRWRKDSLILFSSVISGALFESRHQKISHIFKRQSWQQFSSLPRNVFLHLVFLLFQKQSSLPLKAHEKSTCPCIWNWQCAWWSWNS